MALVPLAPDILVINLCQLPKILVTITPTCNSWLFDCIADICIYNQYELFTEFVKSPIALSGITYIGISLRQEIVLLILVLEDGQVRAQIQMTYVLYISQSPISLINLHKFNKTGLYQNNQIWYLSDDKQKGQIVGYISKWWQS